MKTRNRYLASTLLVILLAVGHETINAQDTGTPKALIICVDGILPIYLDQFDFEYISQIRDNGVYADFGEVEPPGFPAKGIATLLTGETVEHNVTDTLSKYDAPSFPTLFSRLENKRTAALVRDEEIINEIAFDADVRENFSSDEELTVRAAQVLATDVTDIVYVHLTDPMDRGKEGGLKLSYAPYFLAVQNTDQLVGRMMKAIASRTNRVNEDWMIVFTGSHGATIDGETGGKSILEVTVPVYISGDFIAKSVDSPKEGKDNAVKLLTYRKDNPAGSYGGMVGIPDIQNEFLNEPEITVEMTVKQDFSRSGWQSLFDHNNDGCLLALQNEDLKIYGLGGTTTIPEFKFLIGVYYSLAISFRDHTIINEDGVANKVSIYNFYVNGEEFYTDTLSGHRLDRAPFSTFTIGSGGRTTSAAKYHNYSDGVGLVGDNENFLGTFNEIRYWKKVLSPETIHQFWDKRHIENDHPDKEDLVFYLKADEVSGPVLTDFSGNGRDATANWWTDGWDGGRNPQVIRVPARGMSVASVVPSLMVHFKQSLEGFNFPPANMSWYFLENVVEEPKSAAMKHYPDPASDYVMLSLPSEIMANDAMVHVFTPSGTIILSQRVGLSAINTGRLDLKGLGKGFYVYRVDVDGHSLGGRLTVK